MKICTLEKKKKTVGDRKTNLLEGLDAKIDSLDDLDAYTVPVQEPLQDAESFMNELKKYIYTKNK